MSFADPQSSNIGSGAVTLPRVGVGFGTSTYQSADGNLAFILSNTYGKRTRRVARLSIKKTAADPLFPVQNAPYSMAVYFVIDVPQVGFSLTEVVGASTGLFNNLTASTNANLTKLAAGEN